MADMELIESIRRTEQDIRQVRSQVKDLAEELESVIMQASGYQRVAKLTEELGAARKDLQFELSEDTDYKATSEAIGELKFKMADLQSILSQHLLEYREATNASFVEEEDSKKVRHIEVKAKLGKPEYHQEEMGFTGDVEISDPTGKVIHRSAKAQSRLDGKSLAAGEGKE